MIERGLLFDPVLSPIVLCGVLIACSILFLWMEWRKAAPYAGLRIIAVIVMMTGLAGFLFRPLFQTEKLKQIILLTPGYDVSHVDSLADLYPTMDVLRMADAQPYRDAPPVSAYHDLSGTLDNLSFVVGQGLPAEAIDLLDAHNYRFIPAPYPHGIIRLSLSDNILPNRMAVVEGVYNNASGTSNLFLVGPGGKEDSASFTDAGIQHFKLTFVPKQAGNFLYTIASENASNTLPVHVLEQKPLKILCIEHYPTFETRYLKEFLGQSHSLVLRYQLSRGKYRHEYINHETVNINRLSEESLAAFDLLIIGTDALRVMPASETRAITRAVEGGLGLLPLYNSSPTTLPDLVSFGFTRYASDTAHVSLQGQDKILPVWPISISDEDGIIAVSENKNRVLSGYRYQGFGKIAFQLIRETYRLTLQGDSIAYSAVWSQLLEQISRPRNPGFTVHPETPFPLFSDIPVTVKVISSSTPEVTLNDLSLPLKENVAVDDWWSVKFWTGQPGWNKLKFPDEAALDIYISKAEEWQPLAIAQARDRTLEAAAANHNPAQQIRTVSLPIPPWIFYFVFLAGAGFLWLAPKL